MLTLIQITGKSQQGLQLTWKQKEETPDSKFATSKPHAKGQIISEQFFYQRKILTNFCPKMHLKSGQMSQIKKINALSYINYGLFNVSNTVPLFFFDLANL